MVTATNAPEWHLQSKRHQRWAPGHDVCVDLVRDDAEAHLTVSYAWHGQDLLGVEVTRCEVLCDGCCDQAALEASARAWALENEVAVWNG